MFGIWAPLAMTFTLTNATPWEAKQVEVCLSYSECDTIANVIPSIDGTSGLPDGTYQVAVNGLNEFGVTAKLAGCGIGKFLEGKIKRLDGSVMTLVKLSTPIWSAPRPANLHLDFADEFPEIFQPAMLEAMSGDIKNAGTTLMKLFGLAEPLYRFDITYKEGSDVTTTDHDSRTIQIPPRFSSPCEFWWVMRHEMEHVAQKYFANQCALKGQTHLYSIQFFRELSAYLGDMAYAPIACDGYNADQIQRNSIYNIARYLKMGPNALPH